MFKQTVKKFSSAAGAAQQVTSRLAGIMKPVAYYSRISISFLGQVASHSKLASFPDIAKATQGKKGNGLGGRKEHTLIAWNHWISGFIAAFGNGAWKTVTIKQAVELLGEGVKIGGFFVVGEMVGRGSIIGYHIPGTDHALAGDHH